MKAYTVIPEKGSLTVVAGEYRGRKDGVVLIKIKGITTAFPEFVVGRTKRAALDKYAKRAWSLLKEDMEMARMRLDLYHQARNMLKEIAR